MNESTEVWGRWKKEEIFLCALHVKCMCTMCYGTHLCGNVSSFLKIFRISSPSNTNKRSGCPIRPPTFAILPYCWCREYMTLSKSWMRYWPDRWTTQDHHENWKINIKRTWIKNIDDIFRWLLFKRTNNLKILEFCVRIFLSIRNIKNIYGKCAKIKIAHNFFKDFMCIHINTKTGLYMC